MNFKESHEKLTSVISAPQLGSQFTESELAEMESHLLDEVVAADTQGLAMIAESANVLIRFGTSPELRQGGLEILTLMMESDPFRNNEALQNKIFAYLNHVAAVVDLTVFEKIDDPKDRDVVLLLKMIKEGQKK